MNLINLENVNLAYGDRPLLADTNFDVSSGERICVVGRNGEGKSTLLKIIQGIVTADDGSIWRKPDIRIATLEQVVPNEEQGSVFEVIAQALSHVSRMLDEYTDITHKMVDDHSDSLIKRMGDLQHQLDAVDGWHWQHRVDSVIERLSLDKDAQIDSLSGGYKRRVLLGRALVSQPDVLLLDEPTNHLDIDSVQWLEDYLLSYNGAIVFVTHDRTFLQNVATRIVELDRGVLTSYECDYATFLKRKEENLEIEATHNAKFDKVLAQEEVWIRQGIKARRTRNEGRVRALQKLRNERAARRELQKTAKMKLDLGRASGKLVAELEGIQHQYDDRVLIKNFSAQIVRGDRIGVIGSNGVGKSTLLNIILGKLTPQQGNVTLGTKLQVAYFDQQRSQLDMEKSVIDNLNHGSDHIEVNGQSRHVIGYLQDFLFAPQRARSPVKSLSGGECNRLLLARLFINPANLLVLDEPTNDLDVETLELLEDILTQFKGTILMVSHDRTFLDNVVTSTLVFEGEGKVNEYVGGYSDWRRYSKEKQKSEANKKTANDSINVAKKESSSTKIKKLSYKEQRELDTITMEIDRLEQEKSTLEQAMSDPQFYKNSDKDVKKTLESLDMINKQIKDVYSRWEQLES